MRRVLMVAVTLVTLSLSGVAGAVPNDGTAGNSGNSWTTPPGGCGNSGLVNGNCASGAAPAGALHSPEIDGAGALAVLAMLGGVLTLVGERRRQKK